MQNFEMFTNINPVQTLPSGLVIELKTWAVEDVLWMAKPGQGGKNLDPMMELCTVVEHGELYGWEVGQNVVASELLQGDRLVIITLQRIYTHFYSVGPFLSFDYKCIDMDCLDADSTKQHRSVDLRRLLLPSLEKVEGDPRYDDFEIIENGECILWPSVWGTMPIEIFDDRIYWQGLTPENQARWVNGNEFEYFDRPTDTKLTWQMLVGRDEHDLAKFRKDVEKMGIEYLKRRIKSVEGVSPHGIRSFLAKWDGGAYDRFQAHVWENECGVDQEIEVACGRCREEQDMEIPLGTSFYAPASQRRKRGKRSTSR